MLDTNLSKDIFVLYDPYSLSEASYTKEKLITKAKEAANNGN